MRYERCLATLVCSAALLVPVRTAAWGLAAHRMVEEQAIELLPEPLRTAFRAERRRISEGAVEPDTVLRERYGAEEAVKHFIDLDRYGAPPFRELPRSYRAAVARFGAERVRARGILPWAIERAHARLVRQLRAGDWPRALDTAAHGGHYVADATMPLHTVSDYDGRASGSPGLHRAVEHDLVDAHLRKFLGRVRRGLRPASPSDYSRGRVFEALIESYDAVPRLIDADHRARRLGPVGSAAYVEALEGRVGSMVAARLARAVQMVGGYWLSAWEEAGRPVPPGRSRD